MKKFLAIVSTLFIMASSALANDCEINISSKQYRPLASATFPLVTLTDLKLNVEQPSSFGIGQAPIIFFPNNKMIGFSYRDKISVSQSKPDIFYLRLFGLLPLGDDITAVQNMRTKDRLCNTQLTDIKLTNNNFMAFMRRLDKDFINVYILPVQRKGFVYILSFKGFSEEAVGGIITTIN